MLIFSNTGHQTNLFGTDLLQQLDPNDPLLRLASVIPGPELDQTFAKLMCQHFSRHMVKQQFAAIRSLPATNSHWLNVAAHGCKRPQYIQTLPV